MGIEKEITKFIRGKEIKGLSPHTIRNYKSRLNKLSEFLGTKSINEITNDDFVNFLFKYDNERSRAIVGRIIKHFLDYFDVEIKAEPPSYKLAKVRAVSKGKIENILSSSKYDEFDRTVISLLVSSGLRAGELVKLKIKDLDFDNLEGSVISKGKKDYEEPDTFIFDNRTRMFLLEHLGKKAGDKEKFLFVDKDNLPFTYYKFWEYFVAKFGFRPHQLRHTFCVENSKMLTPVELQTVARHKRYQTTERYLQPDKRQFIESAKLKMSKNGGE